MGSLRVVGQDTGSELQGKAFNRRGREERPQKAQRKPIGSLGELCDSLASFAVKGFALWAMKSFEPQRMRRNTAKDR
jgi:hypothetical protein